MRPVSVEWQGVDLNSRPSVPQTKTGREALGSRRIISVEEVECTALENDWDAPPNPLMHPPCLCPKCKVDPLDVEVEPGRLRASGMRQRPQVEALELGSEGQGLL